MGERVRLSKLAWVGVHTTMRQANDRGYECLLLSNCTAAAFPETYFSVPWSCSSESLLLLVSSASDSQELLVGDVSFF